MAVNARSKAAGTSLGNLRDHGQAVWLDFLARPPLADGDLKRLVAEDGLSGVTSNPAIFEKAIAEGSGCDTALRAAQAAGDIDVMALYERLAIADIQQAADVLRPVYRDTDRVDGYVSLEVSPYLALDTEATIAQVHRLAKAVDRENVMFKVPATSEGLSAIRQLVGEGININITLLFSQRVYEQVAEAYLSGLEQFIAAGGDPHTIASVASFFVSRIDAAVDELIEQRLLQGGGAQEHAVLRELRGKVAIANAKLAYQRYKRLFSNERWERLKASGARPQRLLWASTSTKNPDYRDVLYVEELIGRNTVNTMPPATMDAFRDHGRVRDSLEEGIAEAERVMGRLEDYGISIDEVTTRLTGEGVRKFADAFDKLLAAIARKRTHRLGERLNRQTVALPDQIQKAVDASLDNWRRAGNVRRLWAGDSTLWTDDDEDQWLAWLDIVKEERERSDELGNLARDIAGGQFCHAVLLGMGGSSLGAEVLAQCFGRSPDHPDLLVLDSTHPAQIRAVEAQIDLARTLFIVASKSGTTLEANILKDYFFERMVGMVGIGRAGLHFIAITDPGTGLQETAHEESYRHIALGEQNIGGRYSVLSDFGMVPAATMGLDVDRLLAEARMMVRSCGPDVPPRENPGVHLGILLGEAARAGRNKLTIVASPGVAGFGAWLEQLIAESTGKQGNGIIPVDAEPVSHPDAYGHDRLFAYFRLSAEPDHGQDTAIADLERAGHPVVRIEIGERYRIAQEFFRWEVATAVAGAVIGINPFNQPDVEASKVRARELTDACEAGNALPDEVPVLQDGGIEVFADEGNAGVLKQAGDGTTLARSLGVHLGRLHAGDYCAILAFIDRNERHLDALQDIRTIIRDHHRVATCVGFGPRFLHSTGQAYKGGPNSGVFLQITGDCSNDVVVPGRNLSFGAVIAAQARGDLDVLNQRGRRTLRVHLGGDVDVGLATLKDAVRSALM